MAALLCLAVCAARVAADGGDKSRAQFGSVRHAGVESPIRWQGSAQVELTAGTLRFTRSDAGLHSEPLPLVPLQRYRISTTLARGPGSTPRFALSYLDAQGHTVEWTPAWQHKNAPHANWLPLAPRALRYVQGFVLPPGAAQPRLLLRLEPSREPALARYDHLTLSDLRIEAEGPVTCCDRLGGNLLWNGDFEASADPLKHWLQTGAMPDTQVELTEAPVCRHVLRVRPGTAVQLFSRYNPPVTAGRAYRLSLKARGHGRVELHVHSISGDRPTPLRVGNHTDGPGHFDVQSHAWQELSTVWFAEAPNVALAEVVIVVSAVSAVEIDAIALQPFE